jgi:hypothetical protein
MPIEPSWRHFAGAGLPGQSPRFPPLTVHWGAWGGVFDVPENQVSGHPLRFCPRHPM